MALYLLYAAQPQDRNSTGRNAVLVDAADEASARTAAAAAAPDGETANVEAWAALELASAAGAPFPVEGYVWLSGDVAEPLLAARGT
ncbi:MAG: hypothetical protein PVI23_08330 [Maricaulaceae bacterium]